MKKLLLILSTIFLFSACSEVVKIENGQIPKDYIDELQPFLGDWVGAFEGHNGTLNLSLNQSDQLIVEFIDNATNDLIPGCESSIGLLKEVEFKEKNGKVRIVRATFSIDANKCSRSIMGQQLHFYFNKTQTAATIKLLQKQWREFECREVGRDPGGIPIRECEHVIRERYLRGEFYQLKN